MGLDLFTTHEMMNSPGISKLWQNAKYFPKYDLIYNKFSLTLSRHQNHFRKVKIGQDFPGFNFSSWREEMMQRIINKWRLWNKITDALCALKMKPFGFKSRFLWALPDSISIHTKINLVYLRNLPESWKGAAVKFRIENIFSKTFQSCCLVLGCPQSH